MVSALQHAESDAYNKLLSSLCNNPTLDTLEAVEIQVHSRTPYVFCFWPNTRNYFIDDEFAYLKDRFKTSSEITFNDRIHCLGLRNKIRNAEMSNELTAQERTKSRELRQKCHELLQLGIEIPTYQEKLKEIEVFIVEHQVVIIDDEGRFQRMWGRYIPPNQQHIENDYSLIERAFNEGHYELVKLLARSGSKIHGLAHLKFLPAVPTAAAQRAQIECIKVCLEHGLELQSFLDKFSPQAQIELVCDLIAVGLNVNRALEHLLPSTIDYPLEVLQELMDRGAQTDERTTNLMFHDFDRGKNKDRLRILIFNGAPVNLPIMEAGRQEGIRMITQSARRQNELTSHQEKYSRNFSLLYRWLQIRDTVLQNMRQEMNKQAREALRDTPAFAAENPPEIGQIILDYCSLTLEDVAQDPTLRKRLCELSLAMLTDSEFITSQKTK